MIIWQWVLRASIILTKGNIVIIKLQKKNIKNLGCHGTECQAIFA